jgi:hypothetical protein
MPIRAPGVGSCPGAATGSSVTIQRIAGLDRCSLDYPTAAAKSVPRDALVAVGTFDPDSSEIVLTGEQSAAAVAEWLAMPQLDPSELRRGLEHPLTVRKLADPEIKVVVNGDLALALIRRSGLRREDSEWVGPDGRRTAAVAEAVLWALLRIAAAE